MPVEVPDYVSAAAQRGLDWHKDGKSGDGVTEQTIREAGDMASGSVSEDKVRRMGPWFRRHEADMNAPNNKPDSKQFPGAGAVAWALWGGPTSGDIMRTRDWAESKTEQLDQDEATVFDQSPKIKNTMSKLTPEAEVTELRTVALALTAERDDLRSTVEKLTVGAADDLASAKADISAKDSRIAELTAELDQFKAVADAANAKVEAVEKTAVSAAKQAADIVASTGIDPVAVNPTAPTVSKEAVDHVATFLALPIGSKERTDYWKANQHQIVRGLSF